MIDHLDDANLLSRLPDRLKQPVWCAAAERIRQVDHRNLVRHMPAPPLSAFLPVSQHANQEAMLKPTEITLST
jgi:hypothetical protein